MNRHRREFLRIALGAAATAVSGGRGWGVPTVEQITPSVSMVHGPVNGVMIKRRGGTLAIYGDPRDTPAEVKMVFFTHHRRDVV